MTKPNPLPDLAYLQACFSYDPETGILTWRERPLEHFARAERRAAINTKFAGKPAGQPDDAGYLRVKILGTKFHVSRIIWKLVTGEDPPHLIDHRDTDPGNNRWINLRPATYSQNMQNTGSFKTNSSGFKNVYFCEKTAKNWGAQICFNRKKHFLGYYDTPEEAHDAATEARTRLHGEFARTS